MCISGQLIYKLLAPHFTMITFISMAVICSMPAYSQTITPTLNIGYNIYYKDKIAYGPKQEIIYSAEGKSSLVNQITEISVIINNQIQQPTNSNLIIDNSQSKQAMSGLDSPDDVDSRYKESLRNSYKMWSQVAKTNSRLEIVFQILNAADLVETVYCLDKRTCHEENPIFGRHPSTSTLIGLKVLSGALHYVGYSLIKYNTSLTRIFEISTIVIQGGVVAWNAKIDF